jgi:MFS family permease
MDGATVGLWLGLIAGVGGGVGTYLAGWLGDRLGEYEPRWYLWISGIGAIGSVPFLSYFYWTSNTTAGLLALVPAAALYHAYSGLGHAVAQSLVKPRMRAVTSAVSLFMMNLVGFGLGPQMVGITNDLFKPYFGEEAIRYSLLLVTVVMLWSTMHYFIAARTIRVDLEAKNT